MTNTYNTDKVEWILESCGKQEPLWHLRATTDSFRPEHWERLEAEEGCHQRNTNKRHPQQAKANISLSHRVSLFLLSKSLQCIWEKKASSLHSPCPSPAWEPQSKKHTTQTWMLPNESHPEIVRSLLCLLLESSGRDLCKYTQWVTERAGKALSLPGEILTKGWNHRQRSWEELDADVWTLRFQCVGNCSALELFL